jgi:hypothetical protein
MELVKLKKKHAIIDSADQKMPFLARYPYFFDILGLIIVLVHNCRF